MLAFIGPRRSARGLAIALWLALAAGISGDAAASQKTKKPQRAAEPVAPAAVQVPAAAPARFFTINQVLAKHDTLTSQDSARVAPAEGSATDGLSARSARQPAPSNEPFGLFAFRAPEGLLWVKWRRAQEGIDADAKILTRCRIDAESCTPAARQFLAIVDDARKREGRARIEVVNRSINATIRYMSDIAQHGVVDVWSAPLASLASGHGDCEDYAIAKYVALRDAGVATNDLRLLLVRDRVARQDHAVVAVRSDGQWLVLDNRHLMVSEAAELPQFVPLFALGHEGVRLFAAPYARRPALDGEAPSETPRGIEDLGLRGTLLSDAMGVIDVSRA